MFLPSLVLAASTALSNEAVETFVQRVADAVSPRGTTVAIGALPQGWSSTIPLPEQVTLLGSLRRSDGTVDIYFQPQDAVPAYNAYLQRLQSAGFAVKPREVPFSSGFVETTPVPENTLLCRGGEGVNIRVAGNHRDDLRVDVMPQTSTMNGCAASREPFPHLSNPLPDLFAPEGVTVSRDGGGMSQGIGVNGVTANITYGALLQGNVTAKALLKNYVAQFERAGWHTVASSFGENAGFASVSRTIEGSTWNALLTLYQADRPHAYFAQLSASGKPVRQQVASNERLPALPQSLPKSQTPLFLELVKRILNGNEPGQTALIIGKLPSDLPSAVPLPEGRVLGSTITVANLQGGNDTATLYLDMTGAQLQAYENVLAREGWLGQSLGRRTIGGFQSAPGSEPVIYCKESQPPITIVAHPGENAVAVTVDRSSVADACRPFPAPPASFGYNLPNIVAPSRSIHRWTSGESTGVSFETSLTPAAVLDSFAKQMASQGWTPSAAISNETAATQTFTRTDPKNGTHRAVLTIYRSGPKPDVYSAILDVT